MVDYMITAINNSGATIKTQTSDPIGTSNYQSGMGWKIVSVEEVGTSQQLSASISPAPPSSAPSTPSSSISSVTNYPPDMTAMERALGPVGVQMYRQRTSQPSTPTTTPSIQKSGYPKITTRTDPITGELVTSVTYGREQGGILSWEQIGQSTTETTPQGVITKTPYQLKGITVSLPKTPGIMPIPEMAYEMKAQDWLQRSMQEAPIQTQIAYTIKSLSGIFDVGKWIEGLGKVRGLSEYGFLQAGSTFLEHTPEEMYEIQDKGFLEKWWGVAGPAYTNVVIPYGIGKVFTILSPIATRLAGPTAEALGKTGITGTATISRIIAHPLETYFAATIPPAIGIDIGITAALEQKGYLKEGALISKLGTYGVQFSMMGLGATSEFKTPFQEKERISEQMAEYPIGYRGIMGKKSIPWYGERGLSGYEKYQDVLAEQKILSAKLEGLKNIFIKTETVGIRNPENPNELFFISIVKGQDVFTMGKAIQQKTSEGLSLTDVEGKLYYKIRPENVFYQEKPISGISAAKYIGEKEGYMFFKYLGLSMKGEEVRLPILDEKGEWISEKVFYDRNQLILSKGESISKILGEKIINEKGFLEQRKSDIDLVFSEGKFKGELIGGEYIDRAKIYTPKIEGKEYYGEGMGFDTGGLIDLTTKEMMLPGGIGATRASLFEDLTNIKGSVFDVMETKGKLSFEEEVYYSPYWTGVKPDISKGITLMVTPKQVISITPSGNIMINKVEPISETSNVNLSILKIDQATGIISVIKPAIINLTSNINLQRQEMLQKTGQTTINITDQQQKQLQQQITMQITKQVQLQIPQLASIISPMIETVMPFIPEFTPYEEIPTEEKITITGEGVVPPSGTEMGEVRNIGGFDVLVKNPVYSHGARVHPDSFKKVTSGTLNYWDALALGADIVGNTPKATFKVIPSESKPGALNKRVPSWESVAYQYKKKDDDTWIELPTYRINSPGELEGITMKGIEAHRRKRF